MNIEKVIIDGNEVVTIKAEEGKNIVRVNGGVLICKQYTLDSDDSLADFIEVDDGNDYRVRRRNAYPSIADQLDMLYHDRIDGTDTWFEAVKAVKESHPKEQ